MGPLIYSCMRMVEKKNKVNNDVSWFRVNRIFNRDANIYCELKDSDNVN